MDAFDVMSKITTLRELRIAENELEGNLPANIGNLASLEVLELQNNKLASLPNEIRQLTSLRLLNVANNQLTSIPMELFETGLIELVANKNRFEGPFFTVASVPSLQELNISNCSLKTFCDSDSIDLPALKTLNVSMNRLASLPSVESWTNLQALIVAENKLTAFPEGFTTLSQLRTADFTANDISQIDERIALMSLEHLTLAANPLRERKFLTMAFDDMKRDLAARLPADPAEADENGTEYTTEGAVENVHGWEVTPSGTLDLSSKTLNSLDEDAVLAFADTIRHFNLQQNAFESIPTALSHIAFLTVLDLSRNSIATALTSHVSLPKLKELRLSANKLTSLDPLTIFLSAPALQTLDVSNNSLLGTLPPLRSTYPQLISLIASDNRVSEVPASSLDGLKIVNLANNDIERLEPQIGLLQGSLTSLNVEGNKFRVPSWTVLQKGTEAVLGWLRDRIPRESWRSDGTVFFDAEGGDGEGTF
jgi:Leucine-rich repeat (LRR) protein